MFARGVIWIFGSLPLTHMGGATRGRGAVYTVLGDVF